MAERVLRVCALYPDLMNIYADRGNLLLLERRCEWRGIGFELRRRRARRRARSRRARPLLHRRRSGSRPGAVRAGPRHRQARRAARRGRRAARVIFAVCGGYQLLGHGYELGGERLPGVGLVDLETVREDGPRLIGNVAIEVELGRRPAGARRLREPRRAHPPGAGRAAARAACCKGHGNNGARRLRGRPRRRRTGP